MQFNEMRNESWFTRIGILPDSSIVNWSRRLVNFMKRGSRLATRRKLLTTIDTRLRSTRRGIVSVEGIRQMSFLQYRYNRFRVHRGAFWLQRWIYIKGQRGYCMITGCLDGKEGVRKSQVQKLGKTKLEERKKEEYWISQVVVDYLLLLPYLLKKCWFKVRKILDTLLKRRWSRFQRLTLRYISPKSGPD